ncbi:MAG: hypothetical protein HY680_03925 [Chloroflexi bacterium]|nr:hypothetical protein [Chloroflexota bacterium]
MQNRLFSALWVPVLVVLATVGLIVGVGELLLAAAGIREELGGVKEPLAVLAALALALIILVGASVIARSGRKA